MFGVDVEFRQERRAADGAEVPVDRLAGVTRTCVSPERTRNLQRRSVDIHICHERRATFPLAVAAVAEVHVVGRRREEVADRAAKASAFELSFHGRHFTPAIGVEVSGLQWKGYAEGVHAVPAVSVRVRVR